MEWELLNRRKPLRHLVEDVIAEWKSILADPKSNESDCQRFLKDLPHFFFWSLDENVVISEFYLNTDKRVDLVVGTSQYSYGFHYNLIELESPNAQIFIQKKTELVPSPELSVAIEQVNSWISWINMYKESVKELLPSKKFNILETPHFSYSIFIGRRTDDPKILQKINEYHTRFRINIHSYDKLTDDANLRLYLNHYDPLHAFNDVSEDKLNEFANPYRKAYKFSVWKEMIRSNKFSLAHMISENIDVLLSKREYSEKLKLYEQALRQHTGTL